MSYKLMGDANTLSLFLKNTNLEEKNVLVKIYVICSIKETYCLWQSTSKFLYT